MSRSPPASLPCSTPWAIRSSAPATDTSAAGTTALPRLLRQRVGELASRCHVELPEDLAEVIVHRARAEKQPSGDLTVRGAPGGQERDLRLLRGEVAASRVTSFARALSGRGKFHTGALGKDVGSPRTTSAALSPRRAASSTRSRACRSSRRSMSATGQGYACATRNIRPRGPGDPIAARFRRGQRRTEIRPGRSPAGSRDYEVLRIRRMVGGETLDSRAGDEPRPQNRSERS